MPKPLRERTRELAARLKFEPLLGSLTRTLSTGQRQRVALAASLLHEPRLLFLDEPTGGVDPRGRRMFWDLINELAASRGLTVLVTTHYMDEAEQCDWLAFILNGRIIAEGQPGDLKHGLLGRILEVDPREDPFGILPDAQKFTPRLRTLSSSVPSCGSWPIHRRLTRRRGSPRRSARSFLRIPRSRLAVRLARARGYAVSTEKVAS